MQQWSLRYHPGLETWLDNLTNEQLKSVTKELRLLARCGNTLRLPHSRALGQKLFELRERHYGYRIYYSFMADHIIILLHGGNKSTQTKDIEFAHKLLSKEPT